MDPARFLVLDDTPLLLYQSGLLAVLQINCLLLSAEGARAGTWKHYAHIINGNLILTNFIASSLSTKWTKVIVNGLTIDFALGACQLHGIIPTTTLYSRVQATRVKGTTYNDLIEQRAMKIKGGRIDMVIDVATDDSNESTNISPVTMSSNSASSLTSLSQSTKRARRSSKQASACKLQAKRSKLDYEIRYKAAFFQGGDQSCCSRHRRASPCNM